MMIDSRGHWCCVLDGSLIVGLLLESINLRGDYHAKETVIIVGRKARCRTDIS